MSSEDLLTEVSTDILLKENVEFGRSSVVFVENIVSFCKEQRITIPALYTICQILQDRYSKMMESAASTQSLVLNSIPKVKEEIRVIELMIKKRDDEEEIKSLFNLAPLLFVESRIPPQDKCFVKLSTTVIVEMSLEEALQYSKDKLVHLMKSEEAFKEQYTFYKDQTTVLTLNSNRCYAFIKDKINSEKSSN